MAQWLTNRLLYNNTGNGKYAQETFIPVDRSGNVMAAAWGPAMNYHISAGNVPGFADEHKFGKVNGTASGNYSTVWTAADTLATILYPWDTAAGTLSVVSSSSDDASGQSGAVTMRVEGLDNDYNEVTADFTLTGTVETAESSETFLVVNRAYILTGATNVGKIQIKNGSTVMGEIAVGMGQTLQAAYTVPAGKTAYLIDVQLTSSKNLSTNSALFIREFGGVFRVRSDVKLFQNQAKTDWQIPLRIPEKSNIDMRIQGSTNNDVSADFDLLLVDN